MEKRGKIRRRQYLISKQFQLKYSLIVVIFMFLIAWLAGYTVYYTVFGLLGEKLSKVYPQGRLLEIFKAVNLTLLIRIGLLAPFVMVISILLSHRMAGPVFRMERYLEAVARGDFSSILKLRRKDEFKGLAEAINKMTYDLRRVIQEKQDIVIRLSSVMEELSTEIEQAAFDKGKIKALASEAGEQVRFLKDKFSRYRVG